MYTKRNMLCQLISILLAVLISVIIGMKFQQSSQLVADGNYMEGLYYSHYETEGESAATIINRLLKQSKKENLPVILDKSIVVDRPIYMQSNSTLRGLNGTKTKVIASSDFQGDAIIIIDTVNNAEVSDLGIDGGSVYDWNSWKFSKLGAETNGILVKSKNADSNVTYTRVHNLSIWNMNGIGLRITETTYESLFDGIEIKCCSERGIYSSATDSIFTNFTVGNCNSSNDNAQEAFGISLEGGSNNYSNFKVYLSGINAAMNIYSATSNNYSNFNIQDSDYSGLRIMGAHNCNFTNFTIDRCAIGIIVQNSALNNIQAQVIWTKDDVPMYSAYRSANNTGLNYVDLITTGQEATIVLEDSNTVFRK